MRSLCFNPLIRVKKPLKVCQLCREENIYVFFSWKGFNIISSWAHKVHFTELLTDMLVSINLCLKYRCCFLFQKGIPVAEATASLSGGHEEQEIWLMTLSCILGCSVCGLISRNKGVFLWQRGGRFERHAGKGATSERQLRPGISACNLVINHQTFVGFFL